MVLWAQFVCALKKGEVPEGFTSIIVLGTALVAIWLLSGATIMAKGACSPLKDFEFFKESWFSKNLEKVNQHAEYYFALPFGMLSWFLFDKKMPGSSTNNFCFSTDNFCLNIGAILLI